MAESTNVGGSNSPELIEEMILDELDKRGFDKEKMLFSHRMCFRIGYEFANKKKTKKDEAEYRADTLMPVFCAATNEQVEIKITKKTEKEEYVVAIFMVSGEFWFGGITGYQY